VLALHGLRIRGEVQKNRFPWSRRDPIVSRVDVRVSPFVHEFTPSGRQQPEGQAFAPHIDLPVKMQELRIRGCPNILVIQSPVKGVATSKSCGMSAGPQVLLVQKLLRRPSE